MEIEGHTANEVWGTAISALVDGDEAKWQASRSGGTLELLHVMFSIDDPRQRWVTARIPGINPAFAIAEIIWIINGREDAAFLNYWNRQLPKYAGDSACYHGAYGYRLRNTFGFDQLERAYHALRNNPNTRQINLQIWDVRSDFPDDNGQAVAHDIPCNTNAFLKVRDDSLEWMQITRSNDIIRGLPYNIIQFTTLQEVMAGWLDVAVGVYNHLSDSLHIYEKDLPKFQCQLDRSNIENPDHLNLPKDISDEAFQELNRVLDNIIQVNFSERQLFTVIDQVALPPAHRNLLLLVAAEEARRNKWLDLAKQLVDSCSNPMLRAAWSSWEARFARSIVHERVSERPISGS